MLFVSLYVLRFLQKNINQKYRRKSEFYKSEPTLVGESNYHLNILNCAAIWWHSID